MKKKCNECLVTKPVSDFGKESRAKNGYKPRCKSCLNAYYNSLYPKFKEKKLSTIKKYYLKNKNIIAQKNKVYSILNKERKSKYNKEYNQKNKLALNIKKNNYEKLRVKNNDSYRLFKNMRKLVCRLVIKKSNKTEILLGYTHKQLLKSLGRPPLKNESIDHKIPVSWFLNFTDIKIINHFDNLQILLRSENSKKSNTFSHPVNKKYHKIVLPFIKQKFINQLKTI